jgi:diadenosine tetraphosphate (Ap4A) HIT family hydrolase
MTEELDKYLYCRNKAVLDELMIKICDLDVSTLYLFKEQTHKGRCVVAYKDHVNEQFDIPEADFVRFMLDVRRTAQAIKAAFSPNKVNWGAYSDTLRHAHWHIVPKYEGQAEWGGVFAMNPKQTYLTEEEYAEVIEQIKSKL